MLGCEAAGAAQAYSPVNCDSAEPVGGFGEARMLVDDPVTLWLRFCRACAAQREAEYLARKGAAGAAAHPVRCWRSAGGAVLPGRECRRGSGWSRLASPRAGRSSSRVIFVLFQRLAASATVLRGFPFALLGGVVELARPCGRRSAGAFIPLRLTGPAVARAARSAPGFPSAGSLWLRARGRSGACVWLRAPFVSAVSAHLARLCAPFFHRSP